MVAVGDSEEGRSAEPLRVVFVSSEVAPFSKTGGLGDVGGALPQALARSGFEVSVVSPLYRSVSREGLTRKVTALPVPMGSDRVHADVWEGELGPARILFLDPPGFFDRPHLYGSPEGDYADNAFRFAFLASGALAVAARMDLRPDVFHGNDWQSGLVPFFLRARTETAVPMAARSVFTIHNLGYQGVFSRESVAPLELGTATEQVDGMEFHGNVSYLKAGIQFADRLTTVSPTYAREIQTAEFGHGLDGLLRALSGRLTGILNGIDTDLWNPASDPHLPARYSRDSLAGKTQCKLALQREMGLPERADVPLFVVVSRLVHQKGWDLVSAVAEGLVSNDLQIAVQGTGSPEFERFFRDLAERHPDKVATRIEFEERRAHLLEAGGDFHLMPSRYEPCGLNQMYAMRYGTLPVVRATGGLEDTVIDLDAHPGQGNGFKFSGLAPGALWSALSRALACYADDDRRQEAIWRAMGEDHSWDRAAAAYGDLYRELREEM